MGAVSKNALPYRRLVSETKILGASPPFPRTPTSRSSPPVWMALTLPTYTPDVEGRAFGADSGSKLSMPDELDDVNGGSNGGGEPMM